MYGSNLVSEIIPATDAYLKLIEQRPSAQRVSTDRALALAKFFKTNNP